MSVLAWLRETIFPTYCASCGAFGEWWCVACRGSVERIRTDLCPRCGHVGKDHTCQLTMDELDAVIATGFYHDPHLRSVVTALKYQNATRLLPLIGQHLTAWSSDRLVPWPWTGETSLAIQHLPTAPARVRSRGFDQAVLIAGACRSTFVPWATPSDVLRRADRGEAQASLAPGELRHANIRGVFSVEGTVPPAILLVDDVLTTGSTMNEAARLLRAAGAKKIYGFALAIGA